MRAGRVTRAFAGYFGGKLNTALMVLVDLLLVLPAFLIIAILSPLFRERTWLLFVLLLAAFQWMITARIARRALGAATLVVGLLGSTMALPAHAGVTITGAGSTWSSIAVTQWAADVARQGLSVNFQPNGSTAGRVFYYSSQVDFAVSEIPFQDNYCDSTGTACTNELGFAARRRDQITILVCE